MSAQTVKECFSKNSLGELGGAEFSAPPDPNNKLINSKK